MIIPKLEKRLRRAKMKTLKVEKELQIPFVAKLTRENLRMLKRALKYASCKVGRDKRRIRT